MNTKYPKLRRPHRKLNFLPNKERSSTQWGGKVTLEDVDRLFDDLESSSDDFESIIPLSLVPKTTSGAKEEEAMENKESSPVHLEAPSMGNIQLSSIGLKGQFQQPAEPVENTSQNLVPLETTSPFAKHGPIKTSSPLEGTHVEEKVTAFSPILFLCGDDDDVPEEPKAASLSIEKTRSQGPVQPSSEDVSEALPNVFSFSKDKSLKDVGDVEKRPEPPLPSIAGPSQPAAVKSPPARKEHASSFLQKLRQTGHSKSPWKSLSPAQEPEEDFLILEEDTPAWFTISRKKDKHRPAQQTKNNNNNDDQLTSDQRLEHGQAEKAETQDTGHGGESANLEEGRAVNKKKKKKASIPSLPSPKRSAVKTMTKGTKIAMETAVPASSTDSDLMDQVEDHEKERKKKGRKRVTEERRPSPPSMPQGQTPHHTSPSQAVQLQASGTVASKKQSSSSVVRKSRPTKVHQEQKTKRMKAGKSVKGRRKEEMLSSESPPSKTPEEQSRNNEMEHSNMGPANTPLSSCEEAGLPGQAHASQAHGKRRRKPPGDWWLSLSSSTEKPDGPPALKAPRQDPKRPQAAAAQSLSTKTTQNGGPKETTRRKKAKRGGVAGVMEEELQHVSDQVLEPVAHSPEDLSSRLERLTPAKRLFDRTYTRHKGPPEPEKGAPDAKRNRRTRKPPGNWWKPSDAGDADPPLPPQPPLPPPQPQSQKARKGPKQQAKRRKSLKPVAAKTITAQPLSTPPGVTSIPSSAGSTPHKRKKMFAAPKTIKRSLAKFQDIFNRTPEVSPPDAVQNAAREEPKGRKKRLLAPLREQYTGGEDDVDISDDLQDGGPKFVIEAPADSSSRRPSWPSSIAPPRCNKRLSDSTLKGFQSGPSSLIILEQHEENAEMLLPLSRTQRSAWLSLGLHAPPLVPLVLQEEDEANLKDWLSMVWHVPNQAESSQVGPEDFDWFCHRGQAIGLQVDMCSESLCNGKILLGSYMKKPLWVDHSATTVFYVSTSCVAVTVDTTDFNYSAGQSFIVPCGHAYSIKNREDEPALMFFCWIPADGPE